MRAGTDSPESPLEHVQEVPYGLHGSRRPGKSRGKGQVRYLRQEEKPFSRALYEEMFPEDEESFVDAYYKIKGDANRILVWEEEGELRSMVHLNPYRFRMRGRLVESTYFVAVATRPQYRHQGCMRRLLTRALEDLYEERQPFAFLMPAKEAIYTPFGFRRMENEDSEILSRASMEELSREYDLFVWKDEEYERQHIPSKEWEATPMMQRIVYLPGFLELIRAREPVELLLRITDELLPENAGDYCWSLWEAGSSLTRLTTQKNWNETKGECRGEQGIEEMLDGEETSIREKASGREVMPEIIVDIAELGSFLFGSQSISELFPKASHEVRQKLEKIRVLKKIFINEVV